MTLSITLREQLARNPTLALNNIFYQAGLEKKPAFESHYIELRKKENRLYADDVVKVLPLVPAHHPLKKEWRLRHKSLKRLCTYLEKKKRTKRILELGCGNGWLSHQLAMLPGADVVGMDLNEVELLQAARVFKDFKNLSFVYADVITIEAFPVCDYIILASSLQYFADVSSLVQRLLKHLAPEGEIHIIDTPIYNSADVDRARVRSNQYFSLQQSAMHPYYNHHSWPCFHDFNMKVLYDPRQPLNRIAGLVSASPFPWLCISKSHV